MAFPYISNKHAQTQKQLLVDAWQSKISKKKQKNIPGKYFEASYPL